ncbi:hypothetical protein QWZ13_14645 [Reinekea marina]|uniref:Uncharacterized protein n=1 Tax=Reinekea marina TaxID=1310421 RepID=A0ABV7WV28_9GAMM|nr:hypothetical protein [Reinekea marina]MBU2865072.1 hypothetical protein [Reinekea forsetii]MDN3650156.1 hypothetical protein [Reinekea marina]
MSYHINAWLENGVPQLQVIDAQTKRVCMNWSYQSESEPSEQQKHEIQRLFRELLLLTCKQDIANCRVFRVGV